MHRHFLMRCNGFLYASVFPVIRTISYRFQSKSVSTMHPVMGKMAYEKDEIQWVEAILSLITVQICIKSIKNIPTYIHFLSTVLIVRNGVRVLTRLPNASTGYSFPAKLIPQSFHFVKIFFLLILQVKNRISRTHDTVKSIVKISRFVTYGTVTNSVSQKKKNFCRVPHHNWVCISSCR